jgi:hypothetical protein
MTLSTQFHLALRSYPAADPLPSRWKRCNTAWITGPGSGAGSAESAKAAPAAKSLVRNLRVRCILVISFEGAGERRAGRVELEAVPQGRARAF